MTISDKEIDGLIRYVSVLPDKVTVSANLVFQVATELQRLRADAALSLTPAAPSKVVDMSTLARKAVDLGARRTGFMQHAGNEYDAAAHIQALTASALGWEHNWQYERERKLDAITRATTAEASVKVLESALEKIACRHVTEQPLWWQIDARTALNPEGDGA